MTDLYPISNYGSFIVQHWHIRLFHAHAVRIDSWWNLDQHQRIYWRFYYNEQEGAYLITEGGDLYPLHADRMYIIPAGVPFKSRCESPVYHCYAHFDILGISHVAMRELFDAPIALPDLTHLKQMVWSLFGKEADGLEDDEISRECRVQAILYEAVAAYLRTLPRERRDRSLTIAAELAPVQPALQYITDHLPERLPIPRLAALCCMSETYFIRRFRECLGETPTQYIQEQRVTRAAQRLLFSDATIEQIVSETGFGNRYSFSRIFKRHTGLSPAAYRKASYI